MFRSGIGARASGLFGFWGFRVSGFKLSGLGFRIESPTRKRCLPQHAFSGSCPDNCWTVVGLRQDEPPFRFRI